MKDLITSRPITGYMEEVFGGKIFIPVETRVQHIRADLYQVSEIKTVKLWPPTVRQSTIRFRLNPHIAKSDLRVAK